MLKEMIRVWTLPKSLTTKKINHHLFLIIFEHVFCNFKGFYFITTSLTQMLQSTNTSTQKTISLKKINKKQPKTKNINNIFGKWKEFSENFRKKDDGYNFATNWDFGRVRTRIISFNINLLIYIKNLAYFAFS